MKKVVKALLIAALGIGAIAPTYAAESAGQAGAYLKMGVGARALGMGSAFTAVANDSTAAFWNPAGLAKLKKHEASFMHANLTDDREYNFFNYAHVLNGKDGKSNGTVALSHIRFGIDGIPETKEDPNNPGQPWLDDNNNVRIFGYFEDTETNTFISYGKAVTDKFYAGLNLKYLKHSLYDKKADAMGLDFGFMYDWNDKTTVGLSVRDLGESMDWNTDTGTKDDVPVTTTLGVAHQCNDKLLIAADLNKVEDMDVKFFCGAEYQIHDNVILRVGSHDSDLTLGASFKLDTWRFDYSYADETLGDAHRISASKTF
jgi:long-subunit fatty acid transport protein